MTDGPAGRSRGRWMRWQTETDNPLSLRHNPSFSLPLFSFSACRDDAVPLVLWLRGEGRGEDGEKVKRKKIAFINNQCLLQPPFLLLLSSHPSHFCCHSPSVSITSFLASPSLHPPFADQNQLFPSFLLELFSSLRSFYFSLSVIVFFTILIISKEFLPPRCPFLYLISLRIHLPESIFFVVVVGAQAAFFQVNFSSSCVNRSAMFAYVMFLKCVCVCVRSGGEWSINHVDGGVCFVVRSWCSERFWGPGTGPRHGFP